DLPAAGRRGAPCGPMGSAGVHGRGAVVAVDRPLLWEVGSRFDKTGGPYLPARAAFGRFVGFEVGWMMWFTRVASQASVANALAIALAFYWPPLAAGIPRAT